MNKEMKKLEIKDLKENFFEAIGKEWMLVTAGTKEKFNTMTASWGASVGCGISPWRLFLFAPNVIHMNL